ncbi:hypothetical protein ACFY8O_30030 [Streptomyces argenteolus]|uniref:Transcriptional regulator n=1 Tax=Streptomyces argenteolus TaxID=67274 RepID=A0ABW6XEG9_9ACTN
MKQTPTINSRLRMLLAQTSCSGSELARAVNDLGAEVGLDLNYQRASVSQWANGTVPRDPVPALVAEAFSRRLGRALTPADVGFPPRRRPEAGEYPRPPAQGSVYRLADLDELLEEGLHQAAWLPRRKSARIGSEHVKCIALMTEEFSRADHRGESSSSLKALTSFYRSAVCVWLSAPASAALRAALIAEAANLAYIAGYLQVDQRRHGAAQQWYRQAAQLAQACGESRTLVVTLRAMSVQALDLGHVDYAVRLAERAVGQSKGCDPATSAFLLGQLSQALATVGRRQEALAALRDAESQVRSAPAAPTAIGFYHPAGFVHQRARTRLQLGDTKGAIADLQLSSKLRSEAERRTRGLVLAELGELLMEQGVFDAACESWGKFVQVRAGTQSQRLAHAGESMVRALLPYRNRRWAARVLELHREAKLRAAASPAQPR